METEAPLKVIKRSGYSKAVQLAAVLGYYWLLCIADRTILAPAFGYQGLLYRSPSGWTQIGIIGLILLCTALTPIRLRQPSDGVLYVLLPLVVVPVLIVAVTDVLFVNIARSLIMTIAGAYLLLAVCSMLPRPPMTALAWRPMRKPWVLAILLSLISYGWMFVTFGVHLRLLSFSDVYGVRAVFSEQAGGPLGYLLGWQANVLNPFFIAYGIRYRKVWSVTVGVLGDLLIYSTTGFKSVLFSVLAIAALVATMHRKNPAARESATGMRLSLAFTGLVAGAYLIDRFSHSITWTSLFVRRLSLVAGVNTGYYVQYFNSAPKAHLAYGVVGKIFGATDAVPPARQIALYVYHTPGDPNVNLWADAYANFGYAGVVLFTLVLGGFLWCYDRFACNADRRAATILIVAPALSLANSALFTCLMTHGMLLALLIITQWPRINEQAKELSHLQVGRARAGRVAVGPVRSARR